MTAISNKTSTIKDVALEAGVSLGTVSQILNGRKRYSEDVESRVRQAAERLAYRPNPHARTMITGRTQTVGLVILDIANPFFTAIINGANEESTSRGYQMLLADAQVRPERERALHQTLFPSVDGLLLASSTLPDEEIIKLSKRQPTVVIARDPIGVHHVIHDAKNTFYQLTSHLIGMGCGRIAYLNGPPLWTNRERRAGYLEALHQAKLEPLEATLPELYQNGGATLAPELLLRPDRPDAVLAFDDLAAIGFMVMAQQLGFRVPQDVAVAGAGNLPLTDLIRPSLTTVDTNTFELGRQAMCLLLDQIEGKPINNNTVIVKSRLVIRESTQFNRI